MSARFYGRMYGTNDVCMYCGDRFPYKELTVDHIEPKVHGGKRTIKNVAVACQKCNREKGRKSLLVFWVTRAQRQKQNLVENRG